MKVNLFCPTQKQVDIANEQGVDLIKALKLIAKFSLDDKYYGRLKTICINVTPKQRKALDEIGVDFVDECIRTYINEIKYELDREYVKDDKEIKVELNEGEFDSAEFIKRVKEILDNIDIPEWKHIVVTNAKVGCAIQNLPELEITPLNKSDSMTKIFSIGKYNKDIEVKVDPYMSWDDCRLICIL